MATKVGKQSYRLDKKAVLKIPGEGKFKEPVYVYTGDNKKMRTIFMPNGVSYRKAPDKAKVEFNGETYTAEKFGSNTNQRPSYDFEVSSAFQP
ncbi:MAG: hypothetical protein ABEJ56_05775 [Candidatus Nanohaloarchaea archaeon]